MIDDERLERARALAARLPDGFVLGTATSAFQIEGAVREGGRGESVWDAFTRVPGAIAGGATADVAADHYHRYAEDVALLADLGADSYRFSLSWTRLQPEGRGALSEEGAAFYDRLLDALLAAGIRPFATLFHWDTPTALRGRWLDRDTASRFADLAYAVGERFGDRVPTWATINEPATVTLEGYALGVHAPGATRLFGALPTAHHQLLGHGLATQALRASAPDARLGIVNVHTPVSPATDSEADTAFAQLFDVLHNRIFTDPVLLGRYPDAPEGFEALLGALAVDPADLATIAQPLDFLGLNYYMPSRIAAGSGSASTPDGDAEAMRSLPFHLAPWPEYPTTGFGWPIAPEMLGTALDELAERYGEALPPVVITESGVSLPDRIRRRDDGAVEVADDRRIDYIDAHLRAALDAVADSTRPASGIDLRGFHVWSLLDNFEWAAGYTQRFGLVHVDFNTLERTPKRSFEWFREVCRSR
ncbi:GH1 family beta-glucosidase [Cnuibacter sp. UC19_7]|uniref:GH1 family beta-glucosidase n=1 Tax=Cnuibacter sp. UC19_7 TaxID=3350166 RepID=UPI003671115D